MVSRLLESDGKSGTLNLTFSAMARSNHLAPFGMLRDEVDCK